MANRCHFLSEPTDGKDTPLHFTSLQIDNIGPFPSVQQTTGLWRSGSASALHAESPGFDSPHLHHTKSIRVRAVQGARLKFECVRTRGFKSHRMHYFLNQSIECITFSIRVYIISYVHLSFASYNVLVRACYQLQYYYFVFHYQSQKRWSCMVHLL